MGDRYILDENDQPIAVDCERYLEWHNKIPDDIKTGLGFTLARTVTGNVIISTVFLSIDHRFDFSQEPEPILWETMVFCDGSEHDEECVRATSRSEALANHQLFCSTYIKGLEDDKAE